MARQGRHLAALFLFSCSALLGVSVSEISAGTLGDQVKKRPAKHRQYRVPAGSILVVQLRTSVSSGSVQVDDQVDATLAEPVMQEGIELIPAGSIVHGTIEDVIAASDKVHRGRLTMAFAVVQHARTRSRAGIRTRSAIFDAQEPARDSTRSKREPNDVVLPAGYRLLLTLAEPLIVLIPNHKDH